VSETFISRQLQHNVAVDIQASHDILFAAAGNSHQLVGGNGNLTLDAANDIIFSADNYVIETKSGAVTVTAGGDIGAPGHCLSLVSGGPGVDAAGDILLTAGGDIFVGTATATAAGKGKVTAVFSANAGGDFSASGLIDVVAAAQGKGTQQASAGIHITAGNLLTLHGLTDLASVQSRGPGANLTAIADVGLAGHDVTDSGNMTILASLAGHAGQAVAGDADLILQAASNLTIDGNLTLLAAASFAKAGSVLAHGTANIGAGHMTVNGAIVVAASALNAGKGGANGAVGGRLPRCPWRQPQLGRCQG
jgi:hypothetical protein